MTIKELMSMPVSINANLYRDGCSGYHESLMQSYHLLGFALDLLRRGTPGEVVIQIVKEIQAEHGPAYGLRNQEDGV